MTHVRRVVAADIPDIVTMARAFHAESPIHRNLRFNATKVRQLVDAARQDDDWLVIAAFNDDDTMIGMAMVFALPAFFSDDYEMGDLTVYVAPEARGTRAALLMVQEILRFGGAKNVKMTRIGLNTGINHDLAARFFAKLGLPQVGILVGRA